MKTPIRSLGYRDYMEIMFSFYLYPMKLLKLIARFAVVCLCMVASTVPLSAQKNNAQYINPFIGTGGHGHTYPGANHFIIQVHFRFPKPQL